MKLPVAILVVASLGAGKGLVARELTRQQQETLDSYDSTYSEKHQMVGCAFKSPGYHSQVPAGTWVHPTRQSLQYAAALLARNGSGDVDRATTIIRKVISLQDTNPKNRTYGIWSWLLEEPCV